MRIVVDTLSLDPTAGGILQYFGRVMAELQRAATHEYTLLFRGDGLLLDELLGPPWRAAAVDADDAAAVARLARAADLVYTPSPRLRQPLPLASVITVPDVLEAYHPEHFPLRTRFARYLLHGAAARRANRVVTLSEFSRAGIAAFYAVPPERIAVAPPVPADFAGAAAAALPAHLPEDFLLYPANPWPHKNHGRLLAALAAARDRHGAALPCVLTGAPVPGGRDIAAAVAAARLGGAVVYLGFVDAATLAALYRRARALVFPSLFEGFGLPVAEAMRNGVPVACADSAGLVETAGDAALYFRGDDSAAMAAALLRLWTDAGLRANLVGRGHRRAARFSAELLRRAHESAFSAARDDFATRRQAPAGAASLADVAGAAARCLRRAPFTAGLPPARATP